MPAKLVTVEKRATMKVTRDTETGDVTITLAEGEASDLTFEIAMTPSTYRQSDYFQKYYTDPRDMPLSRLHREIHKAIGTPYNGGV